MSKKDRLVFVPLGGSGEIGMNLNLYGFGPEGDETWIVVDCGVTFAGDGEAPGIDLIFADHSFIAERRDRLAAIILTHAHEDHVGAIAHMWPDLRAPVYATRFTALMAREKLAEKGLNGQVEIHEVPLGGTVKAGPFSVEYISITHSILEPNALAIRTPLGTVMHTGDWKIDPDPLVGGATDVDRLRQVGKEGVRAIVCDSTNALSPGRSGSEAAVRRGLIEEIGKHKGRVAVTTFASNAARMQTIFEAAAANDRTVVVAGRSIHRMLRIAKDSGYLQNVPDPVDEQDAGLIPRENTLILCTGSQGEARSALWRIATGQHSDIKLELGDTAIFSSKVIPGNEKSIFRLYNTLARLGVTIVTEKQAPIHVSGHPCRDELKDMYGWIRPEIAVPVHGEALHMIEHAKLAREMGVPVTVVPHNGIVIELAPAEGEVVGEVPAGRLYVDGNVLTDAETGPASIRRRMGFAGAMSVAVVLGRNGSRRAEPAVALHGVPELFDRHEDGVVPIIEAEVARAIDRMDADDRMSDDRVVEVARQAARRPFRIDWGKKPMTEVRVIRLGS